MCFFLLSLQPHERRQRRWWWLEQDVSGKITWKLPWEFFFTLSSFSLFFTTPKHLMLHYFLRLIFNAILLFSQPTLPHFFFSFSCVYDVDGLGKLDFNSWKKEREDSFINFVHALLNFLIYFVFSPLCIASSSRLEVNEFLWESEEQENALRKM